MTYIRIETLSRARPVRCGGRMDGRNRWWSSLANRPAGRLRRTGVFTMAMVCPQCNGSFDERVVCPTCGVRLLFHTNLSNASGEDKSQWADTPWGRLLVGMLLAQGLAHGLQLFLTAGMLAADDSAQTVWTTLFGLVLLHGLQGISLVVGGAIAGAGQ